MSEELRDATNKIVKEYSPEKIILFGSWAWGKPDRNSDIDLFVVKDTKKTRRDRQIELRTKLFPSGLPLDILVYTSKEVDKRLEMGDFFIRKIINKGKVLYARTK